MTCGGGMVCIRNYLSTLRPKNINEQLESQCSAQLQIVRTNINENEKWLKKRFSWALRFRGES